MVKNNGSTPEMEALKTENNIHKLTQYMIGNSYSVCAGTGDPKRE